MRSSSIEEIVSEAKRFVKEGVQELTLIAQDTSRYGYDWDHKLHLSTLLKQLDQIEGVKWIRILYLYPDEIPDDLLDTIEESKHILPYFDIPIQHGNLEMLKKMNRRSNPEEILERTSTIRKRFPNAILRTTLITGFPGETKAEHEENLALLKQVQWDHLGVFTYSKEEDTPSYELEDTLSQEEKNQRILENLLKEVEIEETHFEKEGNLCEGLTFVVTGDVYHYANRNELKAYIESQGGKVTGSVSKSTNYLINNDLESTSSKNQKAKSLGIPIISEEEFIEKFTHS